MRRRLAPALALGVTLGAAAALGCGRLDPPPADPLPPNSFAFGVFGDAPYQAWEQGRYRRLLADVGRTDVAWLLHVGDLFWYPCSDDEYRLRRSEMDALPHAVVYTPGDNEWTDCHNATPGGYDPLDRLAALRRVFFTDPGRTLGGQPFVVETQASDSAFSDLVENERWRRGGFVFATIHMVGSQNGMANFEGRTAASDLESEHRMQGGLAWLRSTFDTARATGAKGVVIAFHAEIGLVNKYDSREGYEPFIARLAHELATFPGQVIVIHGDSHQARMDHPVLLPGGEDERFTRIETYGSPDVGWMRVVVDSVAGKIVAVERRRFRGWW